MRWYYRVKAAINAAMCVRERFGVVNKWEQSYNDLSAYQQTPAERNSHCSPMMKRTQSSRSTTCPRASPRKIRPNDTLTGPPEEPI